MKALALIQSLSNTESRELTSVIKQTGRKGLENLFEFISKNSNSQKAEEKEALFLAAFGYKWVKDKDYLLRNELRILSDVICKWMAEQEVLAEMHETPSVYHYYLLKSWQFRNLMDLFHRNIENWKNEAEAERNYFDLFKMNIIHYHNIFNDLEDSPEKVAKMIDATLAATTAAEKNYVYQWWSIESCYQAANNYKNVAAGKNAGVKQRNIFTHVFDSYPDDDFKLAMQYENSLYAAKQEDYLTILNKTYEHIQKMGPAVQTGIYRSSNVSMLKFRAVILERLIIILCSMNRAAEAATYVSELEIMVNDKRLRTTITFKYNITYYFYFTHQYKEVIVKYDLWRDNLKNKYWLYYSSLVMKAFSHIFLGEFDEVRHCIPEHVQQINLNEYVHFRIAEMVMWYYDEAWDAALRDCDNIKRMLKSKKEEERKKTDIDYITLLNIYELFFIARSSVPADMKQKLAAVKNSFDEFRSKYPDILQETPALAWMRWVLETKSS
jgi:hypothetical protein